MDRADRPTPDDAKYYQPDAKQSIDEFQLAMEAAKRDGYLAPDGQGDYDAEEIERRRQHLMRSFLSVSFDRQ